MIKAYAIFVHPLCTLQIYKHIFSRRWAISVDQCGNGEMNVRRIICINSQRNNLIWTTLIHKWYRRCMWVSFEKYIVLFKSIVIGKIVELVDKVFSVTKVITIFFTRIYISFFILITESLVQLIAFILTLLNTVLEQSKHIEIQNFQHVQLPKQI